MFMLQQASILFTLRCFLHVLSEPIRLMTTTAKKERSSIEKLDEAAICLVSPARCRSVSCKRTTSQGAMRQGSCSSMDNPLDGEVHSK